MTDKTTVPQAVKPANPYKSPEVAAKLLGNSSKQRLTDSTPEYETVVISRLMFSGSAHKWTWALYRTTPRGDSELYAEIPQADDADYAIDQNVLKGIFHLYPEVQYLTSHPQQMAFWPNIECKFKRIKKARGNSTRLALVSFKQCDVYREDEISREEQLQRLMGQNKMNNEQHAEDVAISAQAEAEQEAAAWDELGKPEPAEPRVPLAGRVPDRAGALYHIPAHIKKHYTTDPDKASQLVRYITGGKALPEVFDAPGVDAAKEAQRLAENVDAFFADPSVFEKEWIDTVKKAVKIGFQNYERWSDNRETNLANFAAATGQPSVEAYLAQDGATVAELYKTIRKWCMVQNLEAQNRHQNPAEISTKDTPPAVGIPDAHSESVEPPKSGQETIKFNPISEEPKVMQIHAESPVVVYPKRDGGTVYKDIRFSVTLRVGGTFAMAVTLMDEFAAHPEFVAPDCKVVATIAPAPRADVQPMATSPAAQDAPAANGDVKVEKIAQVVMHSKDTAEGKQITYDLMPLLGNGKVGSYRVVTIRNQNDLDKLTACGVNIADCKPETPYGVNLECGWKNGKEWQPGKFYRDLVYLKPVTMAASA